MNLVKFDYNREQLEQIVGELNSIDRSNIEEVKEAHRKLVKVRTTITGQGKELRDDALKFQKEVISVEKDYLSITTPLEAEFKDVLDKEKERAILEARKELLPQKRKQLELLQYRKEISDDEILAMSDEVWVGYYQNAMEYNQLEIQRIKDEEQAKKDKEERDRIQAENDKLKAEAEEKEKIKKQEDEEAQRKIDEANEKARLAQEELDKKKKEEEEENKRKEEEEKRKEEEQKKLEADKKYQVFLKENNFNEETDRIVEKEGVVRIYRLIAEFKK